MQWDLTFSDHRLERRFTRRFNRQLGQADVAHCALLLLAAFFHVAYGLLSDGHPVSAASLIASCEPPPLFHVALVASCEPSPPLSCRVCLALRQPSCRSCLPHSSLMSLNPSPKTSRLPLLRHVTCNHHFAIASAQSSRLLSAACHGPLERALMSHLPEDWLHM